ncbi:Zn(II)2Cys6 transcription factor [Penicillium waksmanii]|uniref:Zn(II)2Cys6 transcription factor n=1 Tax=Penicillium waksmanii TaxID=69791 RepID=UPI002547F5B3|nr:Zn(II)2Cys6 transcription factor [Penicillium waksmanii]KAJ5979624.1 Zn(II)2Cys6 transcription factor [Penicillium waksmanii]
MAETTCGCAFMHICPERPNASLVSVHSAFNSLRSFRLSNDSTEDDMGCDTEKSNELGYNDIHLELLGAWKCSLFQEMYGVPESLLGLLSQTVRLANEQELLHRDTELDPDIVMTLNRRTKLLEQSILSWEPSEDMVCPQSGCKASPIDTQKANAAYHSAAAVHQALVLFYYRRVHNINALMLQDTVRKVIKSAELAEEAAMNNRNYEASLLWPIFIASCEAVDRDLQNILHEWLLSTGNRTHVPLFAAAADTAQRVWELRQKKQDYTLSWFNAVSDDRCPIIAI